MTPSEWRDHAAKCRSVAETLEEAAARRILLEAAEDYLATAERESALERLMSSSFQNSAGASNASSHF
jgi:hypothetical protein